MARPPPWRNPRKGRDQILPSGNLDDEDDDEDEDDDPIDCLPDSDDDAYEFLGDDPPIGAAAKGSNTTENISA